MNWDVKLASRAEKSSCVIESPNSLFSFVNLEVKLASRADKSSYVIELPRLSDLTIIIASIYS